VAVCGCTKSGSWVICGRIGRAVGLKGECRVRWMSGACPVEIGGELFVAESDEKSHKPYTVAVLRRQGRFDIVRFVGISDRNAAEGLGGLELFQPEGDLPALPEGEYYCYQILGMRVATEEGRELGRVVRIFTAGERDVYEVMPDGGGSGEEILIPASDDVILSVDVENERMIVRPMEGMLD